MKIFILEDDKNRLEYMLKVIKQTIKEDYLVDAFDNVKEAKAGLISNKYDVIFLDHDLGGKTYMDSSNEDTGYQIAKYITKNNIKFDKCIIHSLNLAGAYKMSKEIRGSEYLPITSWDINSLKNILNQ